MKPQRLDSAWVLALLADLADEILDHRHPIASMDTRDRVAVARIVLSRTHDVQALSAESLPHCPRCLNSGALDIVVDRDLGGLELRRTVPCPCGHPIVQPGGDR